jgi:hypothetical protein
LAEPQETTLYRRYPRENCGDDAPHTCARGPGVGHLSATGTCLCPTAPIRRHRRRTNAARPPQQRETMRHRAPEVRQGQPRPKHAGA